MRSLKIRKNDEPKLGTIEQAAGRYNFGRNTMRRIAGEAGAVIKSARLFE